MDPFNPFGQPGIGAPQVPQPKKPKKPDPAARRMKALDYASLLLGIEPPPPDAELPPPVGFRFPEQQVEAPYLPPPPPVGPPPSAFRPPMPGDSMDDLYKQHIVRMRSKLTG